MIYFPNANNNEDWARQRPWAEDAMEVSHVVARAQVLWDNIYCFPRVHADRKLDRVEKLGFEPALQYGMKCPKWQFSLLDHNVHPFWTLYITIIFFYQLACFFKAETDLYFFILPKNRIHTKCTVEIQQIIAELISSGLTKGRIWGNTLFKGGCLRKQNNIWSHTIG